MLKFAAIAMVLAFCSTASAEEKASDAQSSGNVQAKTLCASHKDDFCSADVPCCAGLKCDGPHDGRCK